MEPLQTGRVGRRWLDCRPTHCPYLPTSCTQFSTTTVSHISEMFGGSIPATLSGQVRRATLHDDLLTTVEESALLARGFQCGTAPGALVIGWNDHHTAVTLADGTAVASGEGGGVKVGGGGAYQA